MRYMNWNGNELVFIKREKISMMFSLCIYTVIEFFCEQSTIVGIKGRPEN